MKPFFFSILLLSLLKNSYAQLPASEKTSLRSVRIGNQTWMAENLDVTSYRNGDTIPQVEDPKIWSSLKTGAWCYYENRGENGAHFGKLYNWYAVNDPRGLAPEGWHVPSDAEWNALAANLGGRIGASPKLKASRGWAHAGNGINETGFTALPGGTRSVELFSFGGNYGYWWSSTEFDSYSAWNRFIAYNNDDIGRSTGWKQFGNSVRCLKDEPGSNLVKSGGQSPDNKKDSFPQVDSAHATIQNDENSMVKSVMIGSEAWMAQNLDVATFQNGDTIHQAVSAADWIKAGKDKQPAWCYYNNDTAYRKYGKLYNWYAVSDKRGLAPVGWHIPNEDEWSKLIGRVGAENGGARIKSVAGWKDKGNGDNETGFAGMPAGFRTADGEFYNETVGSYWWSATESSGEVAYYHSTNYFTDQINTQSSGDKQKGFSVRCIRD